jgi:hypothetical protein
MAYPLLPSTRAVVARHRARYATMGLPGLQTRSGLDPRRAESSLARLFLPLGVDDVAVAATVIGMDTPL